ncbi:hypothetical protein PR048_024287 [Dryococelus australis]|uniref:Protein kinase domain-containing protein n=1 Tax=Dryococelus australis TaxID=614101 RepID=A0ABQ9GN72_9NEOP|nr:hypothetical protein PR048_024287 [Dryococelus australis]
MLELEVLEASCILLARPACLLLAVMGKLRRRFHGIHYASLKRELMNSCRRSSGGGARAGIKGRRKREIPEKTRRPAASSGTIPTRATPPRIEPGSPRWGGASCVTTAPPRPRIWLRLATLPLPHDETPKTEGRGERYGQTRPRDGRRYVTGSRSAAPTRLRPGRTELNPRLGHSRIFASGNIAGRCRWSTDFLRDLPFRRYSILTITHVGSQDLVVKSRENLFARSLTQFPSLKVPVYLHLFSASETEKRGSNKVDTASRYKCAIAANLTERNGAGSGRPNSLDPDSDPAPGPANLTSVLNGFPKSLQTNGGMGPSQKAMFNSFPFLPLPHSPVRLEQSLVTSLSTRPHIQPQICFYNNAMSEDAMSADELCLLSEMVLLSISRGGVNGRSPRKPADLAASSGTFPTLENPGVARPGIEPGFVSVGGVQANRPAKTSAQREVRGSGRDSRLAEPELEVQRLYLEHMPRDTSFSFSSTFIGSPYVGIFDYDSISTDQWVNGVDDVNEVDGVKGSMGSMESMGPMGSMVHGVECVNGSVCEGVGKKILRGRCKERYRSLVERFPSLWLRMDLRPIALSKHQSGFLPSSTLVHRVRGGRFAEFRSYENMLVSAQRNKTAHMNIILKERRRFTSIHCELKLNNCARLVTTGFDRINYVTIER